MKIASFTFIPYKAPLLYDSVRQGAWLKVATKEGLVAFGEISPLPGWSRETLSESLDDFKKKESAIKEINWSKENLFSSLQTLNLLPSALFGLETALLDLLDPINAEEIEETALFMGSSEEIRQQAKETSFRVAKIKVSHLSPHETKKLLQELSQEFLLRIDANKGFNLQEALDLFSCISFERILYVEEPLKKASDLLYFPFPLAIDESYPSSLSVEDLYSLPSLRAVVYKPTIQGGISHALPLLDLCTKRKIDLVFSSAFETSIGLMAIKKAAKRLSLKAPVGTGTSFFFSCPFKKNTI